MIENMAPSKTYRFRTNALPFGILAYVAIAVYPPPAGSLEIFPFFKWSLFSTASDKRTDVVAIIQTVDGKKLSEPTLFYDMKNTFKIARKKDTRFAKTLDRLSYAIINKNAVIEHNTRNLIENHYMQEIKKIDYDIAVVKYNPIEKYRYGKIENVHILRSYTKNAKLP